MDIELTEEEIEQIRYQQDYEAYFAEMEECEKDNSPLATKNYKDNGEQK